MSHRRNTTDEPSAAGGLSSARDVIRTTERGKRAFLTWAAGVALAVVSVAVGFVATPLLLRYLGVERLGAARALAEWFSYVLVADLGLATTIAALLSRAKSEGRMRLWAVARFGFRVQAVSLLVLVPAGITLAWFMPSLINCPAPLEQELRVASLLWVVGMLAYPFSVHRSMLEVCQRGYVVNFGLIGHSLIWTSLSVFLAWWGWGLVGQSVAAVAAGGAFAGLTVIVARSMLGRERPPTAQVSARTLLTESWPISLNTLGRRLMVGSDLILVGIILNASVVAMLFVTQRLVSVVTGQINGVANASWAGLAEMRRVGEQELFERRICEVFRLIIGLNLAAGGAVASLNPHFVRLWVGGELYGGDALTLLTVLVGVMLGISAMMSLFMDLTGDARRRAVIAITAGAAKVGFAILLLKHFGVIGVLLAHAAAWLLTEAWWYPTVLIRRYGVRPAFLAAAIGRGVASGALWMVMCIAAANWVPEVRSWPGFLIYAAVILPLTAAYCWLAVLSAGERREWWHRLANLRTA